MKIAVVVAHFDDEVIWCGSTVEKLGCLGQVDTFVMFEEIKDGKWRYTGRQPLPDLSEYDLIITHGEQGEYGHKDHTVLHREVVDKYGYKVMTFGGAWDFSSIDYVVRVTPTHIFNKARKLKEYEATGKSIDEICYVQCLCSLEAGQLLMEQESLKKLVLTILEAIDVGKGRCD